MSFPRLPAGLRDRRYTEEDILLSRVLGLCARMPQLYTLHVRPARTLDGWRTPVSGDGKGFPDLLIVGPGGLIFRELKSTKGRLTADQAVWRDRLLAAGQDWAIWRPADWDSDRIRAELRELARTPARRTA